MGKLKLILKRPVAAIPGLPGALPRKINKAYSAMNTLLKGINTMNILNLTKGIAGAAVSLGVGTVVGNAVKATTPGDITKYQKVVVAIGGLALTGLVSELAANRTEDKIDELSDTLGYPKDADIEVDISVEEK